MNKQSASILGMRLGVSSWPTALIGIVMIKGILSLAVKPGSFAVSYSGISYFVLLVLGTCFAMRNGIQNTLGRRLFWVLLATAYGLWSAHQALDLYYELGRGIEVPDNSIDDSLLFLHVGTLLGALATLPHSELSSRKQNAAVANAVFVTFLWIFVYGYAVFPYQYLFSTGTAFSYALRFDILYLLENLAVILTVGVLVFRAKAPWKSVYFHLLAASTLYALGSTVANLAIDSGGYLNGKLYGLCLTASVCWFVWIPLSARQVPSPQVKATPFGGSQSSQASVWPMVVVVMISIPTVWELFQRNENSGLRKLRVVFAVVMIVCLASTAYIKEHLAKRELASQAQGALQESEERLRMAVQAGRMFAYSWDASDITERSGESAKVLGIDETAPLRGHQEAARVHPDDRGDLSSAIAGLSPEEPCLHICYRIIRADQDVIWVERSGRAYFDEHGKILRIVGMVADITDRKLTEQALRESEERFRLVANSAPVMIWMSGVDKLCVYFNRPWLEFTGRSFEAEMGNGWAEGVCREDLGRCLETYARAFDRRESFQMEYRLRRRDGEYRWVLDHGAPRFSADGSFAGYIGSCIDVTEQKLATEALCSVNRRLIQAHEEERSRIARELHDDINQRLAMLAVELDQVQDDPSEVQNRLPELRKQVDEISKDLQAMSHELHSSKLEYLGVVGGMKSWCKELAGRQKIEVDFRSNVSSVLPPEVGLTLFRVLQEALHNAVKHSGVRRFDVQLREDSGEIHLIVSDLGRGFDVENALQGKGLGLTSMRERVRLVNGTMSIESGRMGGTSIDVCIPLPLEQHSQRVAV